MTPGSFRWDDLKDRVDLLRVAVSLLGEPPGRRGEKGRKVWWNCPFHDDPNPSFAVDPERRSWKCFGCGEHGDAPALVMRLRGVTFRDAVAYLAVGTTLPSSGTIHKTPTRKSSSATTTDPDALTSDEATEIVNHAEARLWTDEGKPALDYLRSRGLADATIESARLGWTPRVGKVGWSPCGITIPWFRADRLILLKIRPDQSFRDQFAKGKRPPKYIEAYRSPFASDRDDPPVYPGLHVVQPKRPVVVCEGEFDALLLGQELFDLAGVLSLGGAANGPGPSTLSAMTPAWPRFTCHDDDDAGDKSAAKWPASFRRVKPPGSLTDKDWSDAYAHKINLRRWWIDRLRGIEKPALYSWDELQSLQWPGASGPPEPGIDLVDDRVDLHEWARGQCNRLAMAL